ncbi:MAG: DUF4249 family protein [Bacteroidales bacterium]|nr:DUF4249 family protein [Bacteroidales bacterium]
MKKFLLPIMIAVLGLSSCEEYFELKGSEGDPKMYVECYAGLTDTTFIKLYKAVPVNSKRSNGDDFNLQKLDFTINGTSANLTEVDNTLYWTADPIPTGAKLAIDVQTKETAPVHATTTVPAKPSFTTEVSYISGSTPMFRFHLKMDGHIAPTDRFGISIKEHVTISYDNGDEPQSYYENSSPVTLDISTASLTDILMAALMPMPSINVTGYPETIECAFYSGEDFTDGEIDVAALFTPTEMTWEQYKWEEDEDGNYWPTDTVTVTRTDSLSVTVVRLSDESFGYMNALYNQETDIMAMAGLSPAHFAYTNVAGGYGVLGGLTLAGSPWYDAIEIINN